MKAVAAFPMVLLFVTTAAAQQAQNPSPMVEHARAHQRLSEERPRGVRAKLRLGELFVPDQVRRGNRVPLLVHFHGASWIAEIAGARRRTAVISFQLGSGSAAYARPFRDEPALFGELLAEGERISGLTFHPITLSGWSAGYGSIREILSVEKYNDRIDRVLLIDGLHTGYVGGRPGPLESRLETEGVEPFVRCAEDAVRKAKRMMVVHSEIFPGTFASTTETADYLLARLGLRRKPVLRWAPMGMQQISEARKGWFLLKGFAGNTAPDHVDQLHALPDLLKAF